MTVESLSYAIDDQDHLIKVDAGYYRFAEENGWDGAGSSLGRSLWDFVAGQEMQKLQRLLLRRIRDEVREVELPFRCDGPDVRREMKIRIVSHSSGRTVMFAAHLDSEESRDEPQPVLDPDAPRGDDLLAMCGWCDRFEVDGEWVEVEEAARRLELFRRSELPALDHGVCSACSRLLLSA
jgi:hypothetical protein